MNMLVRSASVAAALIVAGVQSSETQWPPREAARESAGVESRSVDTVRVGCSGGYTGGGSGNTLTRDGQLAAYQRKTWRRDSVTHLPLRRDSAAATTVFAALEDVRFRALRYSKVGNMTCVLTLHDRDGEHDVTWPMGRPPRALAPVLAALERAFRHDRRQWP